MSLRRRCRCRPVVECRRQSAIEYESASCVVTVHELTRLVDGPEGYRHHHPGRQQSVRLAAQFVRPGATVFLHDPERPMQSNCGIRYLNPPNERIGTERQWAVCRRAETSSGPFQTRWDLEAADHPFRGVVQISPWKMPESRKARVDLFRAGPRALPPFRRDKSFIPRKLFRMQGGRARLAGRH